MFIFDAVKLRWREVFLSVVFSVSKFLGAMSIADDIRIGVTMSSLKKAKQKGPLCNVFFYTIQIVFVSGKVPCWSP
jgi:hypothetical protein